MIEKRELLSMTYISGFCLPEYMPVSFFLRFYLFISRERGREWERERETSMYGCFSCVPNWGPGSQPRHVPWLEIKPTTLWFEGQHSVHRAHQPGQCQSLDEDDNLPYEYHLLDWMANHIHYMLFPLAFILKVTSFPVLEPIFSGTHLYWALALNVQNERCLIMKHFVLNHSISSEQPWCVIPHAGDYFLT